jgi:phage shock protein E
MNFIRKLFGLAPKVNCHELIKNGSVLIDVRTPSEYKQGNASGSENIPLTTLASKLQKIKTQNKPVVTCCASGLRSARAVSILKQNGIDANNGGSWKKFT